MLDRNDPGPDWNLDGEWEFTFRTELILNRERRLQNGQEPAVDAERRMFEDLFIAPYLERESGKVILACQRDGGQHSGCFTLRLLRKDGVVRANPDYVLQIAKIGDQHVAQIYHDFQMHELEPVSGTPLKTPLYMYAFVELTQDGSLEFQLFQFASSVKIVKTIAFGFSVADPDELKNFLSDPAIRLRPGKIVVHRRAPSQPREPAK